MILATVCMYACMGMLVVTTVLTLLFICGSQLQAPSLLDLVFDSNDGSNPTSANLPAPEYLPALEKQRQLEQQLAQQQVSTQRVPLRWLSISHPPGSDSFFIVSRKS